MGEFKYVGEAALKARFIEALTPKLTEHAQEVVRTAKFVRTPELSGALVGSERAEPPKATANGASVRVVAGEGLPRPYGEITERKDAIHHDHGGAHFIARSVEQSIPKLLDRVAEAGREAY